MNIIERLVKKQEAWQAVWGMAQDAATMIYAAKQIENIEAAIASATKEAL